jgi:hypothetical protein
VVSIKQPNTFPISLSLFFFFPVVLGFELRASLLLGRQSTTQGTPPAPHLPSLKSLQRRNKHTGQWRKQETFPLTFGISFGHFCPYNAGRVFTGATCRGGPLSSFSQCSLSSVRTSSRHQPLSWQPVSSVNTAPEDTLCASLGPKAQPWQGEGHYSWNPILSPTMFAHFHQGAHRGWGEE